MDKPTLAAVDQYPVPQILIDRVARVHAVPLEYAEKLLREAKRMLYLCTASGESITPSVRVDWAWHEMLMFTRFYKEYAAFIGSFIHHDPTPPEGDDKPDETWEEIQASVGRPRKGDPTYDRTKANYERLFGEKPDPWYWP